MHYKKLRCGDYRLIYSPSKLKRNNLSVAVKLYEIIKRDYNFLSDDNVGVSLLKSGHICLSFDINDCNLVQSDYGHGLKDDAVMEYKEVSEEYFFDTL